MMKTPFLSGAIIMKSGSCVKQLTIENIVIILDFCNVQVNSRLSSYEKMKKVEKGWFLKILGDIERSNDGIVSWSSCNFLCKLLNSDGFYEFSEYPIVCGCPLPNLPNRP